MHEQTLTSVKQFKGLTKIVQQQIETTLKEVVPLWQSEPPADWKRVVRPTDEGAYSINIEPYQGMNSWFNYEKKIKEKESLNLLDKIIRENQPALLGYISHSGRHTLIQNVFNLMASLCQATLQYINTQLTTEVAIKRIITEFDQILATSCATHEILTLLFGLKLPEEVKQIDLGNNVLLRHLTTDEITDLGSNDISSESKYKITSGFVNTALVITREVRITLSEYVEQTQNLTFHQENQDQITAVLCSLHILKTGRAGVVASFTTLRPNILPGMSGYSTAPLLVNPYGNMELSCGEIESFVALHQKIISNQRSEVRIAATRLLDAENRLSPIDSLLDAAIGLEVLLNPKDDGELAFRTALNYAYLGNLADRRKRYENIRDIQKIRNRLVHGGLNLQSKDSQIIHDHAILAKQYLRDCITQFLNNENFAGNKKLDSEFWLDRIIPPIKKKEDLA